MPVHIKEKIRYGLNVISKRRWWIIAPYCFSMLIGLSMSMLFPKVYEATTLISVASQISEDMRPEWVSPRPPPIDIDSRINTISQKIMSRSNLERVIQQFKLFLSPPYSDMLMEEKLEHLRKRIKVEVSDASNPPGSFSISYQDSDPNSTMQVANALTSFLIDENLNVRDDNSFGTNDLRAQISEKENSIDVTHLKSKTDVLDKEKTPDSPEEEASKQSTGRNRRGSSGGRSARGGSYAGGKYSSVKNYSNYSTASGANMEKSQKRVQFQIIDFARLPEKPISPDTNRLFAAFVLSGLVAGFGIIFLLELRSNWRWKNDHDSTQKFRLKKETDQRTVWCNIMEPNAIGDPLSGGKNYFPKLLCKAILLPLCEIGVRSVTRSKDCAALLDDELISSEIGALQAQGDCLSGGKNDFQNVHFSAFYPRQSVIGVRSVIALYAHLQDYLDVILSDVKKFKDVFGGRDPAVKKSKDPSLLMEGTPITVVPECEHVAFNPEQVTMRWESPFIRFLFDFKASENLADETLFIKFSIRVYGLQIAHINLAVEVVEKQHSIQKSRDHAMETGHVYEKVFISYSLKDKDVVDGYRKIFEAFKTDLFVDSYAIEASEKRSEILSGITKDCDAFYLFWSQNAAASDRVRDDLQSAINSIHSTGAAQVNETFLRPIYWEEPLQPDPWTELKGLQFTYLPQLKRNHPETIQEHSTGLQTGTFRECFSYLQGAFGAADAKEFENAIMYVDNDPKGSLHKSRMVLENLLLDAYQIEMGRLPRLQQIQIMLNDNQFTRRIDRRILFRMVFIRNFGNRGSHPGEIADSSDATDCLHSLIYVIQWHMQSYYKASDNFLTNSDSRHSGQSSQSGNPGLHQSFLDSGN